ncbi:MAG: glycoside hydrolase family 75 protein [Verrucomicrobiota bacterium]
MADKKSNEPPENPIAAQVHAAEESHTPPPSADSIEPKPSAFSNALGNLILLVILLCLISIPFLVYFTDTGSRLKREVQKTLGRGSEKVVDSKALEEANAEIAKLKQELASVKSAAERAPLIAQPIGSDNTAPATTTDEPEEVPADIPPTPKLLPRQEYDVAKLFNGVGVKTTLDLQKGDTATKERISNDAYQFEIKLKINVPQANQSVAELAALNPLLPEILPSLDKLVDTAKVSPFYDKLYSLKNDRIKSYMTRLDKLETRHNYFDCETILQVTHPDTGQQALLMQGEMDVVADGSDGDRMPTIDDYISLSTYYQPMTSYGWKKQGSTPNPLIPRFEKELNDVIEEYKIKGLSAARNRYLVNRRDELKRIISDLKFRSYLIAEADPFIVLPLSLLRQVGKVSHAPTIGDYAAVIYGSTIYPVLCGDAGPSWKMGEASLFVAQTINPRASPYNRPVSDLKVTYVVFPGSKDETNGPPDLAKWKDKTESLIDGLGGLGDGYQLHDWRDIIAERRAVRETKRLIGQVALQVANADGAIAEAKKAVSAAEAVVKAAESKVISAKAAVAAGTQTSDTVPPLQNEVTAATTKLDAANAALEEAQIAAAKVRAAAKLVEEAADTAATASKKPLNESRIDTTLVALKALQDSEQALEQATSDVSAARAAAERAKG